MQRIDITQVEQYVKENSGAGGEKQNEDELMPDNKKITHHATKLVKFLTSDGWVKFRARRDR